MTSRDVLSGAFSDRLIWPLLAHPSPYILTFKSPTLTFFCLKSPMTPIALLIVSKPSSMCIRHPLAGRRLPNSQAECVALIGAALGWNPALPVPSRSPNFPELQGPHL